MKTNQWAVCLSFCVLTVGGTIFGSVRATVDAHSEEAIAALQKHQSDYQDARPWPGERFTFGDTMASVLKTQGPPNETWDGSKESKDEGFRVWVVLAGRGSS